MKRIHHRNGDHQAPLEADSVDSVMDAIEAIDQDHRGLVLRLAGLEQTPCRDVAGVRGHLNSLHDLLASHFSTEEKLIAQVCGEAWLLPHQVEHNHLLRVLEDSLHYAASPRAEAGALGGLVGVVTRWLRQELTLGDPVVFMAVRELRGQRLGGRGVAWAGMMPGAMSGRQ